MMFDSFLIGNLAFFCFLWVIDKTKLNGNGVCFLFLQGSPFRGSAIGCRVPFCSVCNPGYDIFGDCCWLKVINWVPNCGYLSKRILFSLYFMLPSHCVCCNCVKILSRGVFV